MNIIMNVKGNNEKYVKDGIYKMTKSASVKKMSEITDEKVFGVLGFILYEDTKNDTTTQILAIEIDTGETFATNSKTFIESFKDLYGMMEELPLDIKVLHKRSKANREYIIADLG